MSAVVMAVLAAGWADAGAFKLRVEAHAQKVTVEVQAAGPVHFKLADAAMVRLEEEHLHEARERVDSLRELLDEEDHQEERCHASLVEQLKVAQLRLKAVASEDVFTRVIAKPGVPVEVQLWTAGISLREVRVDARDVLLPEPLKLPVPVDWPVVEGDGGLSIRDGTVLHREDAGGLGCYGFEGIFSVPGEWVPFSRDAIFTHTVAEGAVARLHYNHLVIGQQRVATLPLSSPTPDAFVWVDDQRIADRTVIVFTAEGPSRPQSPSSRCGGGIERDAVWLVLKPDYSIEQQKVVLLESCFQSVEHTLHYDPRRPLDGLDIR